MRQEGTAASGGAPDGLREQKEHFAPEPKALFISKHFVYISVLAILLMNKVRIFISYAREDIHFCKELEKSLAMLKRNGEIEAWSDRQIIPGQEWDKMIRNELNEADVILFLISPDFLASDYIYDIEVKRAIERHKNNEAIIIPVIARASYWQIPPFHEFQVLPTGGIPIKSWNDDNEAYLDILKGIKSAISNSVTKPKALPPESIVKFELTSSKSYTHSWDHDMHWLNKKLISVVGNIDIKVIGCSPNPHCIQIESSKYNYDKFYKLFVNKELNKITDTEWIKIAKVSSNLERPTQTPIVTSTKYEEDDIDIEDRSIVCHLKHIAGYAEWASAAEKVVGIDDTSNLQECKVFLVNNLTPVNEYLYVHSNFKKDGCIFPTKLLTNQKISLLTILINLTSHDYTEDAFLKELLEAHIYHIQYFIEKDSIFPDEDFFCNAMNIQFIAC